MAGQTKRQTIVFGREMVGSRSKGVENRVCGLERFVEGERLEIGKDDPETGTCVN
jgi:hypothetical protein